MGLLDDVKPTNPGLSNSVVSTHAPYQVGENDDVDTANFNKWNVDIPQSTQQNLYNQIKNTPNIANEGISGANDAADALFNNNTSTFSRAISSRANRMMAVNKSTRTLNNELQNVQREQLQHSQNMNDLNDVYKIKRQNFAGQLKFASEMSNYYNKLSAMKLQALGSIIGGGFSIAGKVMGGA